MKIPKKIVILGHRGMLGNAVLRYFSSLSEYEVSILTSRFGEKEFAQEIKDKSPNYIINCIGIIPQKKPDLSLYKKINIELPIVLEGLGIPTIHPSTDCEFAGDIEIGRMYSKKDVRDARDEYGQSKAIISEKIENEFKNTKIIRTSIIGHEERTHLSLLDWFLNSEGPVNGYTNHYWNGITTLEWSKRCRELIENWDKLPTLNQYGTNEVRSKYDLLKDIKNVYGKEIEIIPFEATERLNKCLASDKGVLPIIKQLHELKLFYQYHKILVTGATGFIGKNLINALEKERVEIFTANTKTKDDDLVEYIKNADFIVHLAGVTRPENIEDFYTSNVDLTKKIINILNKNNKHTPIIYTSSIHISSETDYAKTKKASEKIILDHAREVNVPVYIFRLTNVFGKGVRLKYKFVVANFCYSIAHDIEFSITNPATEIKLLHVKDLVSCFISIIRRTKCSSLINEGSGYYSVANITTITLGKLAEKILGFKKMTEQGSPIIRTSTFDENLYDTYLFYSQQENQHDL